jgi:hypothetical protein
VELGLERMHVVPAIVPLLWVHDIHQPEADVPAQFEGHPGRNHAVEQIAPAFQIVEELIARKALSQRPGMAHLQDQFRANS